MKYLTADVLAGSIANDSIEKEKRLQAVVAAQEELNEFYRKTDDNMKELAIRMVDAAEAISRGSRLTVDQVRNVFSGERVLEFHNHSLGMNPYNLSALKDKLERVTVAMESAPAESDLTKFLRTVQDKYISSAGIVGAGFHVKLGPLLVLAQKGA